MEKLTPSLLISPILFEHTLFPLSPRLLYPALLSFLKELSLLPLVRREDYQKKDEYLRKEEGGGSYSIRFDQFKIRLELSQLPFQPYDAEIFFILAKLLKEEDCSFLPIFGLTVGKKEEGGRRDIACELRVLLIILFIQTFNIHGNRLSMEKKGSWGGGNSPLNNNPFNEARGGGGNMISPINSPRSKAMRFFNNFSENQNIINFVKTNIKTILKLICSENGNEEELMVTSERIDFLSILFMNDGFPSKNNQLSGIMPLNKFLNVKGNLNIVSEWISNNLNYSESLAKTIQIQGLTKSVTLRDPSNCDGKDLKIFNCEDSYIYINSSLSTLHMINCVNCTIFVASVKGIATIDKCENMNLTIASNVLRISNTIDSKIYFYGPLPPILFGDNRGITLAPHNINFLELFERLKKSEISLNGKFTANFKSPWVVSKENNMNLHFCTVKEFQGGVLPGSFRFFPMGLIKDLDSVNGLFATGKYQDLKEIAEKKLKDQASNQNLNLNVPLLAPSEYKEEVIARYRKLAEFKNLLKTRNLTEEQQKMLYSGVQGHFREWLVNENAIKPISELIRMIDQE